MRGTEGLKVTIMHFVASIVGVKNWGIGGRNCRFDIATPPPIEP